MKNFKFFTLILLGFLVSCTGSKLVKSNRDVKEIFWEELSEFEKYVNQHEYAVAGYWRKKILKHYGSENNVLEEYLYSKKGLAALYEGDIDYFSNELSVMLEYNISKYINIPELGVALWAFEQLGNINNPSLYYPLSKLHRIIKPQVVLPREINHHEKEYYKAKVYKSMLSFASCVIREKDIDAEECDSDYRKITQYYLSLIVWLKNRDILEHPEKELPFIGKIDKRVVFQSTLKWLKSQVSPSHLLIPVYIKQKNCLLGEFACKSSKKELFTVELNDNF